MSAHAPPSETTTIVYNGGSSEYLAESVEKALHQTFKSSSAASSSSSASSSSAASSSSSASAAAASSASGYQSLWKGDGKGGAKGVGPYLVAARVVPLPLPRDWKINTQPIKAPIKATKVNKPKASKPVINKPIKKFKTMTSFFSSVTSKK
jgi:hypothetical protein